MRVCPLPSPIILMVSGRDSPRYLDARLSNSIRTLHLCEGSLAACLSPQARTQGLFYVFRLDQELFLLICDGGNREHVLTEFKRFLVADRVNVEDCSDRLDAIHLWMMPGDRAVNVGLGEFISGSYTLGAQGAWLGEKAIVPRQRTNYPGADLVGPKDHTKKFLDRCVKSGATLASYEELRWLTFEAALPTFPDVIQENSFFPESSLEEALSFHKGCYVGQEPIERLFALGKLPREIRYYQVQSTSPLNPGAPVTIKGSNQSVGEVIACAQRTATSIVAASVKPESITDNAQLTVETLLLTPIVRLSQQSNTETEIDETPA